MSDHPFDEVVKTATDWIGRGGTVHQKFSCAKCGERLTVAEANVFFEAGSCDRCGWITDIRKSGCNYLLVVR